jgi:hypothetical protein
MRRRPKPNAHAPETRDTESTRAVPQEHAVLASPIPPKLLQALADLIVADLLAHPEQP